MNFNSVCTRQLLVFYLSQQLRKRWLAHLAVSLGFLFFYSSTSAADTQPRRTFLTADYQKKIIAIVDEDGKLTWRHQFKNLLCLQYLPNGHVLFQTNWTRLVEIDPNTGKIIWEYDSAARADSKGKHIEVHGFQRLENGLTMIAESGSLQIIEVNSDGKIMHQMPMQLEKSVPHRDTRLVRKLENGNYLVCHEGIGFVYEYKPDGKVVWKYEVPLFGKPRKEGHILDGHGNYCYSALRLKNGNTLIATGNGHSILEVTPQKKIVWSVTQNELPGIQLCWVTTLQILPSGNIVLGNCHAGPENPQVIEITRDKEVVWTFHDFKNFGNSVTNTQIITVDGKLVK